MTHIHPTAVVESGAHLGQDCIVGPFCHIGPNVSLGDHSKLHSHVVLGGHLTVGNTCEIFPFACLGMQTQDLKYQPGDISYTTIGDRTVIREYVTVNAATPAGACTRVGSDCLIQSYCHIAHECILGNHVIMSSAAMLAGHVIVGDYAIIGGHTGVVQFARIGQHAFVGGYSKLAKDVLPFAIADGVPAIMRSVNKVGLERRGFSNQQIRAIRDAFRNLNRPENTVEQAAQQTLQAHPDNADIATMAAFATAGRCGLARPTKHE